MHNNASFSFDKIVAIFFNLKQNETMENEKFSLKEILGSVGFKFSKSLGQNFLSDTNLLDAIASDAEVESEDVVVEIGTGAGTLTRAIAKKAKKVFSFELDETLTKVLNLTLQGVENVEVIFKDVLKMSDEEILNIVGGKFKVVANLPYYVTTPILMRFLDSSLPIESLTIMVQKEVADRFVACPKTKDYGAITVAIQMCGSAKITRNVSRNMFMPAPNVDSAVVRIDVEKGKVADEDFAKVKKLVKSAFAMRRKTLENNLSASFGISKVEAGERMTKAGIALMSRGEALSLADYVKLSKFF